MACFSLQLTFFADWYLVFGLRPSAFFITDYRLLNTEYLSKILFKYIVSINLSWIRIHGLQKTD